MATLTCKQNEGLRSFVIGEATHLPLAVDGYHLWAPCRKLSILDDSLDTSEVILVGHALDCILKNRSEECQEDEDLLQRVE